MSEGEIVGIVGLVAWLILAGSAYASYKLEWKTMVQQALIWASIFAALTLAIGFFGG